MAIVISLLLVCCNGSTVETRRATSVPYTDYLIADSVPTCLDLELACMAALKGEVFVCDGAELLFFMRQDMMAICTYDFASRKMDEIFRSEIPISGFFPISKDSIWILDYGTKIYNTSNTELKYTCPLSGRYWLCLPSKMWYVNDNLYTNIYPFRENENESDIWVESRDAEQLAAWAFSPDGSATEKFAFGRIPDAHPADNYYAPLIQTTFNPKDSLFVLSTSLSPEVEIYKFDGAFVGKKEITSASFTMPAPLSKKDANFNNEIRYENDNATFDELYYDKYRDVYLRVLQLPQSKNNTDMTTDIMPEWKLIVADSNMDVKYEVSFENSNYMPALFITEKGVYIFSYDETNTLQTCGLFLFD